MKNINKNEFSDFEREWQEAFEDAEMEPGKDIWNNIDAKLANKETDKYKRKIVYYRWMAAASILFALGLSYVSLNYSFNSNGLVTEGNRNELQEEVDSNTPGDDLKKKVDSSLPSEVQGEDKELAFSEDEAMNNFGSSNSSNQNDSGNLANIENNVKEEETLDTKNILPGNHPANSRPIYATVDKSAQGRFPEENILSEDENIEIVENKGFEVNELNNVANGGESSGENTYNALLVNDSSLENSQSNVVESNVEQRNIKLMNGYSPNDMLHAQLMEAPYIYSIPGVAIIREDIQDEKVSSKLWAGLNVGSSLFDPNFQEGSNFQPKTSPALSQYTLSDGARVSPQETSFKESTDPGISYSLGLNFGLRLSEKWVVQSGIAYAHKSASTKSTTNVQNIQNDVKTPTNFGNITTEADRNLLSSVTQDYQLSNSFEFASIPLKAGYLLIDRKIGVMVLAGVSADLFLANTLSESENKIEEVKVEAGSDSPFRDINFNGVIGAEFSYKLSRNYYLTLEPNYGVALSSFTKSGSSFTSNPQTFGISAGLKFYWK